MSRIAVASLVMLFARLVNDLACARSAVSTAAPGRKFPSKSNLPVTASGVASAPLKRAASDWTAGWGDVGAR